jgi:hypothetical protein
METAEIESGGAGSGKDHLADGKKKKNTISKFLDR